MHFVVSPRLLIFLLAAFICLPSSAQESNPCLKQDICISYGRCTPRGGECVAGGDQDCRRSRNCEQYGLCSVGELGYCTANTDADCALSRTCKQDGLCTAKNGTCQRETLKVTDANRHTAVAVTYHVVCAADAPCLPTPVSVGYHFYASCDSRAFTLALGNARSTKPVSLPHDSTATKTGDSVACYRPGSAKTQNWGFVVKDGEIQPYLRLAGSLQECRDYIRGVCALCGKASATCKKAPGTKTSPGKCEFEAKLLEKATEGDRLKRIPKNLIEAICSLY